MTNPYLRLLQTSEGDTAPAGARNPYSEMLDNMSRNEDQQRALTLNNALTVNPDEEAELRKLHERGKQAIVPSAAPDTAIGRLQAAFPVPPSPALISDKQQFKLDLSMRELMNNIADTPVLKRKYTQEDFARIAHDDSLYLSSVERTLRGAANETGDATRSLFASLPATFGGILSGVGEYYNAAVVFNYENIIKNIPVIGRGVEQAVAAEQEFWARHPETAKRIAPFAGPGEYLKTTGGGLTELAAIVRPDKVDLEDQIAEGVGQVLVTLATAWATGGTTIPTLGFMAMGANQQAEALREVGIDPSQRLGELSAGAAITGSAELVRLGSMMKALPPALRDRVAKSVIGRISGQAFEEGVQEALEGAAHNLITMTYDEDASLLEGVPEQGLVGASVGGIVQGLAELLVPGKQRILAREAANTKREELSAESQLSMLERAIEDAGQTKLAGRDRAALEEFVNEASEGTAMTEVFIAPDSFAQVAQSLGMEIRDLAQQLGVEDQIQDSALASTPIVVPVGKFISTVADTDLAQPLMEVAKLNPFLPSRAEIKAAQEAGDEQFIARAEALAAAVEQDETVRAEAQVISERIAGELTTAGRFTGDANRVYATAATQMYVQLAQRLGITPQQAFDQYPLSVAGQRIGGQPEGQVLASEQADLPGSPQWEAAVAKGLDMSTPARMARAEEQGFTIEAFRGVRVAPGAGELTDAQMVGGGWFAATPETANTYAADVPLSRNKGLAMKARLKFDNPLVIDAGGRMFDRVPGAAIQGLEGIDPKRAYTTQEIARLAEQQGFDGVEFQNIKADRESSRAGTQPGTIWYVANPANIRSVNAAFDPDQAASADLLGQEGLNLFDNPLPVEGKATILKVGTAMTEAHMAQYGRKLYPEDSAEDYAMVLEFARAELAAQMQQPNSGHGWYSKDVTLAIEQTDRILPGLNTPEGRAVFLTFAGIFSSGLDPQQAWQLSVEAFEAYQATGQIPISRAEAARAVGNDPRTTTYKDKKTGEKVTQDAGWGPRNPGNEQQLQMFKTLIEQKGGPIEALTWLTTPQPRADINQLMADAGVKTPRYKTREEREGPPVFGAMIFSEKLGRYTLGLHGVEVGSEDTTVDLWYTRSYRRWTGRLLDKPIGNEGIVSQPDPARGGIERQTIFRLTGDLMADYPQLTAGDVQAMLWFFEKRLWGAQGIRTDEGTNSAGARQALERRGLDFDDGSRGGAAGAEGGPDVGGRPAEGTETLGQEELDGRRPEQAGDGRGRDTRGGLAPLAGAPRNLQGPIAELVSIAEQYASANGIPLKRQAEYVEVDPERGARIAQAYEDMPHAPNDPAVQEAYADLIRQTRAQYDALVEAGYVFTFFDSTSDPYAGNPSAAMRDLRNNKRMAVYGTYDGYGTEGITAGALADNPMLADTGLQWPDQNGVMRPVVANDLFRAVHDAFGHGLEGAGFRARGEENAWQAHVRLFTGPAVGAITSETRGQNNWLNFGPYGETNRTAAVENTIFAEQKTGLMPEWTWTEGRAGDMEATFGQEETDGQTTARPAGRPGQVDGGRLSGPRRLPDGTAEAVHYGRVAGLTATDPGQWGRGGAFLSRDERNRIGEAPPRTYFGLNVGLPGGYSKEAGTGDNTYYAYIPMDRLYDLAEDPDNLVERAKQIVQERGVAPTSALELAVQEAGYAGFWRDHPSYGMAAAVFEPVPVSTERRPDAVPDETLGQGGGLVSAAVRIGGKTYTGRNHDEAAQAARADGQVVDDINETAGFVDSRGKFLRRDDPEAVYAAIAAGQLDPARQRVIEIALRRGDTVTLTSDMLTFAEPGYQARGRRGEYSPRLKEIRLNASADFSTFLHELGHHFLEVYDSTALNLRDKEAAGETLTESEQGVIDDTRRLLTELARQTNIEVEGDVLDWWRGRSFEERVPMHEQFARLTEAYFMEGKAPTPALQTMFQTFRRWMLQVYKSLTELDVELNDEVRGILDRMVAAETDIKTAEENRGLNAMFATKPEFMTDDEWRGYQQLALAATQAAEDELTARSLRDMKWLSRAKAREIRKLQKQAAEQRAIVEAAVTAEVMSQPINRARTFLKRGLNPDGSEVQGPHKLSIEMLKAAYPEGSGVDWTALGYGRYGMLGKDGLDADMVAELFGFDSGDALVRALLEAEPAEATIEGETDRRMLEEFGDLVNEEAINRAADEALHNAMRGRVLAAEYAALAKASGQRKMLAAAAQQIAKQVIGKQNAAKLKPQKYVAAERSAARKAEQALRRNDLVGAATAKRDQLLNFELAREAQRVLKQRNRTLDLFRRVTAAKRDTVSKTRNYDLVQVARAILAAHGMGQVRNAPIEYMDLLKQYDPHLYTSLETTLLVAAAQNKTLADLSVDEFLGLGDLVKQLWDLSREEMQIEIDGRKVELEQITTELTERLAGLGDTERGQIAEAATDAQKNLRSAVGLMASLRRVEFWARSMDGGVVGPFTKYIWRPISEAADRYRADRNRLITKFRELFRDIEPTMGGKKIAAPELGYTFKNKAELLHAILHTGNTSNKRKLLLGRQWGSERPDGTLDESRWQQLISRMAQDGTLTKADFDFAQGVWDLLEETKPLAQATHRKVFGRYFAEITAEPVDTPFGTYKGGYVPAIYDQFFVADAAVRAQQEQVEANDSTMFPSPASGFTKGRVEYNEVLELNLQLLPMHIDRVLKFAHLASPVRDVLRVLRNKGLARGLEQVDPTAQSDMLLPWLQTASRQIVEDPSKSQGGKLATTFFRGLRNRTGLGLMFSNLVNVAQQFTGFPLVLLRVKPRHVGAALVRYTANPAGVTKAVRGASLMMAERGDNQMAAMYNAIEQIIDKKNLYKRTRDWLGRHTYFMQQAVQNVMDVVVWTAAYDQALAQGETEAEAAKQGDAVVRQTQGSVLPEDISRIEKGPAWARSFTHMYSYFSMWINLLGGDVEIIRREIGLRKGAGRLLYVYLIGFLAPAITAQLVADALRGQLPEDEDDDGYLDEWLSWFFMTQAKTALAFVPVAGQAGNAAIGAFTDVPYDDRVASSPSVSAFEAGVGTPASIYDVIVNDGDKSKAVKDTLNLMTLLTGIPFQAAARPIGYAVDVAEGDIEPTSDLDYLRGLATGTASEASR